MIIIPRNYSTRLFPHETCPHKLKEEEEEQVQRIPQFQKIFLGQRRGDTASPIFEYARIGDNARAIVAIMRHGNDDMS